MTTTAVPAARTRAAAVPAARLLAAGAAAAPLYATAVLLQAATRDGYAITRHPASVLANGGLGWVQVTVFLLTGTLMLACTIGARRVLRDPAGPRVGPAAAGCARSRVGARRHLPDGPQRRVPDRHPGRDARDHER